jgi:hypothetical protein
VITNILENCGQILRVLQTFKGGFPMMGFFHIAARMIRAENTQLRNQLAKKIVVSAYGPTRNRI